MSLLQNQSFINPTTSLWLPSSVSAPTGPTGPAGVAGTTGATGPAGAAASPTSLINTTKTNSPIALPPSSSAFTPDTPVATVAGGEYDIQIRGTINYNSGTTTPTDTIYLTLSVGGSGGTWVYGFQPYSPTSQGNFQIRDRLVCASNSTITLTAYNTQLNGSSARYNVSVSQWDANRVR